MWHARSRSPARERRRSRTGWARAGDAVARHSARDPLCPPADLPTSWPSPIRPGADQPDVTKSPISGGRALRASGARGTLGRQPHLGTRVRRKGEHRSPTGPPGHWRSELRGGLSCDRVRERPPRNQPSSPMAAMALDGTGRSRRSDLYVTARRANHGVRHFRPEIGRHCLEENAQAIGRRPERSPVI